jgi:hypothetical protein
MAQVGLDCHDLDLLIRSGCRRSATNWSSGRTATRSSATRGRDPKLFLQKAPESKPGKNRMHLDIAVPDEPAAVERLLALGARRPLAHGLHHASLDRPRGPGGE